MENPADADRPEVGASFASPLFGPDADSHDSVDAEGEGGSTKGPVAGREQLRPIFGRELVRSEVAAPLVEKEKRAVVGDPEVLKEIGGIGPAVSDPSPESGAADLFAFAGEPEHGLLVVGWRRNDRWTLEAQPVPDDRHRPERDRGLGHSPGAGVHSDEKRAAAIVAALEPLFVQFCRVVERAVGPGHRRARIEDGEFLA